MIMDWCEGWVGGGCQDVGGIDFGVVCRGLCFYEVGKGDNFVVFGVYLVGL